MDSPQHRDQAKEQRTDIMPTIKQLEFAIPGRDKLQLRHLILDYNGTIALDGQLLPELDQLLKTLAQQLTIHILTADTHGSVTEQTNHLACELAIIPANEQISAKQNYLHHIGCQHCVAIGNGINDQLLLRDAALGIAVMHEEGVASATLMAADIVVGSCHDALNLLLHPGRLIATLRC
jgi:soluble P-type ATPase